MVPELHIVVTKKNNLKTSKAADNKDIGIYALQSSDGPGTLITLVQLKDENYEITMNGRVPLKLHCMPKES